MLRLASDWVWDFWIADDGVDFHLFFLHASRSLGDQHKRHRNARVGHATSIDLSNWTVHPDVLGPGHTGDFDQTAAWTGSVVRGDDGLWRMFYTGASFASEWPVFTNTQTVGVATSVDLFHWERRREPIVTADARWYETLGTSSWPEEAWRDPWSTETQTGCGTCCSRRGPTAVRMTTAASSATPRPSISTPGS